MTAMILAVDENGAIGKDGGLPWPTIKEDLAWFRHVTMYYRCCVMGRGTWDALGRKGLDGRQCCVVSKLLHSENNGSYSPDVHYINFPNHLSCIDIVVGGASLYNQYAIEAGVVYLTRVKGVYDADTYVDIDKILEGMTLLTSFVLSDRAIVEVYIIQDYTSTIEQQRVQHIVDSWVAKNAESECEGAVSSPKHYTQSNIETIDAIGAVTKGYANEDAFCAGNVVKYISRAPFKGSKNEDLQKALWYLKRLIENGGDDDY